MESVLPIQPDSHSARPGVRPSRARLPRRAWACLLLAGWAALPATAQDPNWPPDGTPVGEVRFSGLTEVTDTYARSQVLTTAGQALSAQAVQEDVRRLLRSGKFLDVRPQVELVAGQAVITFAVAERAVLAAIDFVGNEEFSDRRLLKDLDLETGQPLNPFAVQQAVQQIENLYREEGYAEVNVQVDPEAVAQQRVVFVIEEGPRVRLREIRYEGNESLTDNQLAAVITSTTYFPIFRDGDFDPDQAARDAAAIQNLYRERGYLDAQASYRTEPIGEGGDLRLVFIIAEGTLYYLAALNIEGNTAFSTEALLASMQLKAGDVMRQDYLTKDLQALANLYGGSGYLDHTITPRRVFTETPGQVELTLEITEGRAYDVGRIVIRGNEQTRDKVVRRQLEFYPEERFDTNRLRASEENLRQTGLFELAKITPVSGEESTRDVLVDVTESNRTTQFVLSGGVGSNNGLLGRISYESRNFDIGDWPRSWGEFVRGRAFRGAGQYFRIEASPGTDYSSFRIVFREPYFMDKPLELGTSAYLFERVRDEYDEQRIGTVISLGRRFQSGLLRTWSGEVAFRLEGISIDDIPDFPARDIADAEGDHLLTSLQGRLVRNRTDHPFQPSRGDVLSVSYEQAAGDFTFGSLEGDYTWYKTLREDEDGRKHILALKGEAGYIFGDAPVFERYHAGGIGSMRGFEFRGISPRDGPFFDDDQRIGGDFMVLAGAEYTFPIYTELLRGVLFTDMGTVEEDFGISDWRAAVGVGLRIYTGLAPVPFEFNLAFPIAENSEDDTQVFSFAIGVTF